jgi:hypothetical protein
MPLLIVLQKKKRGHEALAGARASGWRILSLSARLRFISDGIPLRLATV